MQVRRMLVVFALAVSLAGLVIWICLQREGMALTPSAPAKASDKAFVPAMPQQLETRTESRAENLSSQAGASHAIRNHSAEKQPDQRPPKRFLAEESRLIANSQLNQDAVKAALNSPQFNDFVRKMRDEMSANAAARDVGELYIGAIKDSLLQTPGFRINEFACGITVCAGSIEAPSDDTSWNTWTKKFDDNANAPTYVFAELPIDRGDGVIEHRIVFSTDPYSNAITGSF
jgi:hypothetical protein